MLHTVFLSANHRAGGRLGDRRASMLLVVAALSTTLPLGWWITQSKPRPTSIFPQTPRAAIFTIDPGLLDPRPAFGHATFAAPFATLAATFRSPVNEPATTGSLPSEKLAMPLPSAIVRAPLPVPRPADLQGAADVAVRAKPRRSRSAALVAPVEDDRSFLEKLFGAGPTPTATYASLPGAARTSVSGPRGGPAAEPGVAVYDINARTVTLPSGERLEAHSGYGESLDEPRAVHLRMRGATPPATYDLTEREGLFHGVRALRLTPVGGSGAVYGRAGLLAHTFMLGPRGDSNGCVSFRDYDRFLQAYLRGEVRRLVVVPGSGWGGPIFAASLFGGAG